MEVQELVTMEVQELDETFHNNASKEVEHGEEFAMQCDKAQKNKCNTDLPVYLNNMETSNNYSNRVNRQKLTKNQFELVEHIEDELNSTLNELLLQREKTKILNDAAGYQQVHSKLKKEIKRLIKLSVGQHKIEIYMGLCYVPKSGLKHYIENVIVSDLKILLLNQVNTNLHKNKFEFWNGKVRNEWHNLNKFLPEEDIVIYASNFLRKHRF